MTDREWITTLETELRELRQQVEDTIGAAQTDSDADDWITAYHFKTGAIHRLLAKARDDSRVPIGLVYRTRTGPEVTKCSP